VEVSSIDATQGGKTEVNGYILEGKGGPGDRSVTFPSFS